MSVASSCFEFPRQPSSALANRVSTLRLLFSFLLLLWTLPATAQLPKALTSGGQDGVPAPDGQTLASILRELCPKTSNSWTGTLLIRSRSTGIRAMPLKSQVEVNGQSWRVNYSTPGDTRQPAEHLVVIHKTHAPTQYLLAVASAPGAAPGDPQPIPLSKTDTSFAGSDFLLSDFGLEFLHWPEQTRLRGEIHSNRSCHVLESQRPEAPTGGYVRVVSWVDKESGGIIEAHAYDAEGRQVKEFSVGSLKKVNGVWHVKDMEMINRLTGSRSKIEFDLEEKE